MQLPDGGKFDIKLIDENVDYSRLTSNGYEALLVHFYGIIAWGNQAFADIVECSVDEIPNINAFTLYPPKSIPTVMKNLQAGYEQPYEVEALTLKGNQLLVRLEAVNFTFKNEPGRVIGVKKLKDL